MAKKPALGAGLQSILSNINQENVSVPKGLAAIFGTEKILHVDLLDIALNMIDNAEKGILVNLNGSISIDFNYDLQRMQRVFDSVELKRIQAYAAGRSSGKDIRISSKDIKAVMFKPIIRLELENINVIQGRSQFKRIWNFTKESLYDDLNILTNQKIQKAYQDTYDNITSFQRYVLSTLDDNPKNWDEFIEAVLDQIPTAFGSPS